MNGCRRRCFAPNRRFATVHATGAPAQPAEFGMDHGSATIASKCRNASGSKDGPTRTIAPLVSTISIRCPARDIARRACRKP